MQCLQTLINFGYCIGYTLILISFLVCLCAEFQKRVLYLLTDICETLQSVGKQYEPAHSVMHIEQMCSISEVSDFENQLKSEPAKQQLLVSSR